MSGAQRFVILRRMQRLGFVTALWLVLGCDVGSATGAATTPPKEESFHLLFRDDFDTLDAARWQLMTHSWDSNLALFSTTAARVEDGTLRISLTPAPEGTVDDSGKAKAFLGAE